MEKIYRLISSTENDTGLYIEDYDQLDSNDDYSRLFEGSSVEAEFVQRFVLKAAGIPGTTDYLSNPLSWPICSGRMGRLLASICARDIQLVPLSVFLNSVPLEQYMAINILNRIDCYDFTSGECRIGVSVTGQKYISAVYKWVLRANMIPDHISLFRVPIMDSVVFVKESAIDEIESAGMKGVAIVDDIVLV
jgi:hypothetical protein